MLTMDRAHITFALRRPRTCMCRKPRLGSHLFLELDKKNRHLHTHEQNGSKAKAIDLKKGASLQQTRETSHESSERFNTFGKPINQKQRHSVHTKDLNQLVKDGHTDKARCKPDMPNRIPKNKGNTASRFHDDDINEDASIGGQEDNGIASRDHHSSARNVWNKYDMEHLSKAKLGPDMHAASHSKLVPKCVENKTVGKKSPTFNVHGITHHSEEGSQSLLKMEKKKCSHVTVSPSMEFPCSPEARRRRRHTYAQETSDNEDSQSCPEFEQNMHGNCTPGTAHVNGREGMQVPTVRKSSRVPKKRIFDDDEEEPMRRPRKRLEVERGDLNAEHDEAMDLAGDESECQEKEYCKRNEISGPYVDEKKELPLTARQRALRLSKEGGDLQNDNNVDFPDVLQPVLPRKQKESLNEAEQAIKKEEAAKRRKQQMERNAAEIQASAIQKILGQESSRKKREEKLQKQRQEIEQEKQAASMAPAVNSIRWVMGPSGNVVSFSQDVELPKIFSGPCSYPQEREKCAGPSCNNAYKYRDSKTRLPLCSLHCYRAVQELPRAVF